jgi:hypothetical protein
MEETDVLRYVQSTALAVGLPLDEARSRAVALHFGRTVAIARSLDAFELHKEDEPAEIFRPAPFPQEDPR